MTNKTKIYILYLILVFAISVFSVGCGDEKTTSNEGMQIYEVDKAATKVVGHDFEPSDNAEDKIINEMLIELGKSSKDGKMIAPIPDNTAVNKFNLTDGILTIDFSDAYVNLEQRKEILSRAAIVKTLAQIESVEYVAFTVNGQPLVTPAGLTPGLMKPDDFVGNFGAKLDNSSIGDFRIYFADESGTMLKQYEINDAEYGGYSQEEFVLNQLVKGPQESGFTQTLSKDVKINNVVTINNICYVDFGNSFMDEQGKVSDQLVIYSVVNTLSEINGVHKVQISVNGDSSLKYNGTISLVEPFTRNLDYIIKGE